MTDHQMHCANCGNDIPTEQPEAILGYCDEDCKRAGEAEWLSRPDTDPTANTGFGASQVLADEYDDEEGDDDEELDEEGLEGMLAGLIGESEDIGVESGNAVRTYEEAMIMTRDRGLVLTLSDGREYQITIKRSR